MKKKKVIIIIVEIRIWGQNISDAAALISFVLANDLPMLGYLLALLREAVLIE